MDNIYFKTSNIKKNLNKSVNAIQNLRNEWMVNLQHNQVTLRVSIIISSFVWHLCFHYYKYSVMSHHFESLALCCLSKMCRGSDVSLNADLCCHSVCSCTPNKNTIVITEEISNSHTSPRSFIGQSILSNNHIHSWNMPVRTKPTGLCKKMMYNWLCNADPVAQRSLSGCVL